MSWTIEIAARTLVVGIGATAVMDLWVLFLKRAFGVPSLDYALLGRWIGHLPKGRMFHDPIGRSGAIRGEAAMGWAAHYAIGIAFAALLVGLVGTGWLERPGFGPAILFGLASVAAPFLVLQPAMGAGLAARRTPRPGLMRIKSLMTHASFGTGLYLSAKAVSLL
jgi:Protein of unknown function (DUF2938)